MTPAQCATLLRHLWPLHPWEEEQKRSWESDLVLEYLVVGPEPFEPHGLAVRRKSVRIFQVHFHEAYPGKNTQKAVHLPIFIPLPELLARKFPIFTSFLVRDYDVSGLRCEHSPWCLEVF